MTVEKLRQAVRQRKQQALHIGLVQKARDKVCPSCGGFGGKHTRLDCGALHEEFKRIE